MHPLIQALKTLRGNKSYREFAEELGTTASHLHPVLERGRKPGVKFLAAVVTHCDLDGLVLDYLRSRDMELERGGERT